MPLEARDKDGRLGKNRGGADTKKTRRKLAPMLETKARMISRMRGSTKFGYGCVMFK